MSITFANFDRKKHSGAKKPGRGHAINNKTQP